MSNLVLVKTGFNAHVAMDLYHEFENIITEETTWPVVRGPNSLTYRGIAALLRLWPDLQLPFGSDRSYFAVGYQREKLFPYFYWKARSKNLWMYDAWEARFSEIERFVTSAPLDRLMLSSKQAADHFAKFNSQRFSAHWVPEAVDPRIYRSKPLHERQIDVLQLGRKWDVYHTAIVTGAEKASIKYLYEKKPGEIIFRDRTDFIEGLSNSKISICVPSNVTHPKRAGSISTMTTRYLQSMASGCLVLGKLPWDMQFLFDYNPMIEIDLSDPVGQLEYLLSNLAQFQPLIDKNHATVLSSHSWKNRLAEVTRIVGAA